MSFVQGGAKKAESVEKEIFFKMLPRKKAAEVNVRPCSKRKCDTENFNLHYYISSQNEFSTFMDQEIEGVVSPVIPTSLQQLLSVEETQQSLELDKLEPEGNPAAH